VPIETKTTKTKTDRKSRKETQKKVIIERIKEVSSGKLTDREVVALSSKMHHLLAKQPILVVPQRPERRGQGPWAPVIANLSYTFVTEPGKSTTIWCQPNCVAPVSYVTTETETQDAFAWILAGDPSAPAVAKNFYIEFLAAGRTDYAHGGAAPSVASGASAFFNNQNGYLDWTVPPWQFIGNNNPHECAVHLVGGTFSAVTQCDPLGSGFIGAFGANEAYMYGSKCIDCTDEAYANEEDWPRQEFSRPRLNPKQLLNGMTNGLYGPDEPDYPNANINNAAYVISTANIKSAMKMKLISGNAPAYVTWDFHTLDTTYFPLMDSEAVAGTGNVPPADYACSSMMMPSYYCPVAAFTEGQGIMVVDNTAPTTSPYTIRTRIDVTCKYLVEIDQSFIPFLENDPSYIVANGVDRLPGKVLNYPGTAAHVGSSKEVADYGAAMSKLTGFFPGTDERTKSSIARAIVSSNPIESGVSGVTTKPIALDATGMSQTPLAKALNGTGRSQEINGQADLRPRTTSDPSGVLEGLSSLLRRRR
jgi:hypothetical protein